MLPEGARRGRNQGLEGSGASLGPMWAQSGGQERFKSLLAAARGGARGENKFYVESWGASKKILKQFPAFGPPPRAILASILGSLEGPQGPLVGVV